MRTCRFRTALGLAHRMGCGTLEPRLYAGEVLLPDQPKLREHGISTGRMPQPVVARTSRNSRREEMVIALGADAGGVDIVVGIRRRRDRANIARRTSRKVCPNKSWLDVPRCPFAHRVDSPPVAVPSPSSPRHWTVPIDWKSWPRQQLRHGIGGLTWLRV